MQERRELARSKRCTADKLTGFRDAISSVVVACFFVFETTQLQRVLDFAPPRWSGVPCSKMPPAGEKSNGKMGRLKPDCAGDSAPCGEEVLRRP